MLFRTLCVLVVAAAGLSAQNWLKSPRIYESMNGDFRGAADFDGDGDVDLVRLDGPSAWSTGFTILMNDGTGQFTAGASVALPAVSFVERHLIAHDLTGDGIADIAVTNLTVTSGEVLLHAGLGNGSFQNAVALALPGPVAHLDHGDANGDGTDDVAVAYTFQGTSQVLGWYVYGAGGWTFNPGASLPANELAADLAVLDVDGNGVDDLATIALGPQFNTDVVRLFPTTALAPATGPALTVPGAGVPSNALVASDFDGDGDEDLVVLTVPGHGTLQLTLLVQLGGGAWQLRPQRMLSTLHVPADGWAGDLDGNGTNDLLLGGSQSNSTSYLVFSNDGTGSFTLQFQRGMGIGGGSKGAGLHWIDGDPHLDVVGAREILFGDGTMSNPLGVPGSTIPGTNSAVLRDWDQDGDLDVLDPTGSGLINDGRARFVPGRVAWPAPPAGLSYDGAALIEDFDGDGFLDYLVRWAAFPTQVEMRLLTDNGDGTATDRGSATPPGLVIFKGVAGDADGDGDQDILDAQGLWLNFGTGIFSSPLAVAAGWEPVGRSDIDGDQDDDFLMTAVAGAPPGIAILGQSSPGVFNLEVLPLPASASPPFARPPTFADVDDDGLTDVVAIDAAAGGVRVFRNTGGPPFIALPLLPVAGVYQSASVVAVDVDQDGFSDLVLSGSDRIHVLRRIGPGLVYEPRRSWYSYRWIKEVADLDNDGDLDLFAGITVRSTASDASGGFLRQYGTSSAGGQGIRPVLGGRGPVRQAATPSLIVGRGAGGAQSFLVMGLAPTISPLPLTPGVAQYTAQNFFVLPLVLGGAPGVPGAGTFELPLGPLPSSLVGVSVFHQVGVVDAAAPSGFAVTNGLETRIGL